MSYPPVLGELETVRKLANGFSISRWGDGEIKVMEGKAIAREPVPNPAMARELRRIAQRPNRNCLIGIPTLDPAGPHFENFNLYRARLLKYFNSRTGIKYVSALITRPDAAPWIETPEYVEALVSIWDKKRVIAVVAEMGSKLAQYVRLTHPTPPLHVVCPRYGAYEVIDRLERQVLALMPDIVLLSCGPTATVLAHRLCRQGLQALDLGSVGGFLLRWHANGPQPENDAEYWTERETAIGPEDHRASTEIVQR